MGGSLLPWPTSKNKPEKPTESNPIRFKMVKASYEQGLKKSTQLLPPSNNRSNTGGYFLEKNSGAKVFL